MDTRGVSLALSYLQGRWSEVLARVFTGDLTPEEVNQALDQLPDPGRLPVELREGEVVACVDTYELPSVTALEAVFASIWWAKDFVRWMEAPSRQFATMQPGRRIFLLKKFDQVMFSGDVESWAASNGYHVANLSELLAYLRAYPNTTPGCRIAALGSICVFGGARMFTVHSYRSPESASGARRARAKTHVSCLGGNWYTNEFPAGGFFLLVRMQVPPG